MVTIRDVAKYANVSVATVSRVLNNKGQVSEETRSKVQKAIQTLNYRPNLVARTLFKKSSSTIGLILPDITNPFFPNLARAVEDKALSYGYTVILCNTDGSPEKEFKYIELLTQKYVDGIILSTSQLAAKNLSEFNIPIVALDRFISEDIPTVISDNIGGAKDAVNYLISAGCGSIVHFRGPKGLKTADDREKGFLQVVKEKNIPYQIIETDFHIEAAEHAASTFFQENKQFDGIFAGSDLIAIGVMRAATKHGIKIPNDLQLIGFDGIELGRLLTPPLTTIEQPTYVMGAHAVDLIHRKIENEPLEKFIHEFPTRLVKGSSTKIVE